MQVLSRKGRARKAAGDHRRPAMDPDEVRRQDEAVAEALAEALDDPTFQLTHGQRLTLSRAARSD